MYVSAKDLRTHTKEVLDAVNRGEKVIVTYRGNKCAQIVPFELEQQSLLTDEAYGMWKDNQSVNDVKAFVSKLRAGREHDR